MKKDPVIFINHILDSIIIIEGYVEGKDFNDFKHSVQLQDSVIRRLEIIGEAISKLPEEVYAKFPAVPWKNIIGMRNILIHEYFGIDLELTWAVVSRDLPELKIEINKVKNSF